MIYVTRLDGSQLVVNADLVETVEHTAGTVITLTDGKKLVVANTVEEIVEQVVAYRQRIARSALRLVPLDDDEGERAELLGEPIPLHAALDEARPGRDAHAVQES